MGRAIPITSGAIHASQTAPPKPNGIDYAQLIETAHAAELAHGSLYRPHRGCRSDPGQLDLLTARPSK